MRYRPPDPPDLSPLYAEIAELDRRLRALERPPDPADLPDPYLTDLLARIHALELRLLKLETRRIATGIWLAQPTTPLGALLYATTTITHNAGHTQYHVRLSPSGPAWAYANQLTATTATLYCVATQAATIQVVWEVAHA